MKTEVYSWRVSADTKSVLEREARRRKTTLAGVLDQAVQEWLKKSASPDEDAEQQARLQHAAAECFGALAGGNPLRSENTRQSIRERLKRRHAR